MAGEEVDAEEVELFGPAAGAVLFGVVEPAEPFDLQVSVVGQVVRVVSLHVLVLANQAGGALEDASADGGTGAGPDEALAEFEGVPDFELARGESSSACLGLPRRACLTGCADT